MTSQRMTQRFWNIQSNRINKIEDEFGSQWFDAFNFNLRILSMTTDELWILQHLGLVEEKVFDCGYQQFRLSPIQGCDLPQ